MCGTEKISCSSQLISYMIRVMSCLLGLGGVAFVIIGGYCQYTINKVVLLLLVSSGAYPNLGLYLIGIGVLLCLLAPYLYWSAHNYGRFRILIGFILTLAALILTIMIAVFAGSAAHNASTNLADGWTSNSTSDSTRSKFENQFSCCGWTSTPQPYPDTCPEQPSKTCSYSIISYLEHPYQVVAYSCIPIIIFEVSLLLFCIFLFLLLRPVTKYSTLEPEEDDHHDGNL